MTERRAEEVLQVLYDNCCTSECKFKGKCEENCGAAINTAITDMEELQQYRAMGTVNEFKNWKEDWLNKFDLLIEYREIGTVEECRAAREKQRVKKPTEKIENEIGYYHCANCDKTLRTTIQFQKPNYCLNCGQKLDWSEEE